MDKSYVEFDGYLTKEGLRSFALVPVANVPPGMRDLFNGLTKFLIDKLESNGGTFRMRSRKDGKPWSSRYLHQRQPAYSIDFTLKDAGSSEYGSSRCKIRVYLDSKTVHILQPDLKDRRPLPMNPRRPKAKA